MEKYVIRRPTWKKTTYSAAVAESKKIVPGQAVRKEQAQPLKENTGNLQRESIAPSYSRESITQTLLKAHGISRDSLDASLENIPEQFNHLSNTLTSTRIGDDHKYESIKGKKTMNSKLLTNLESCRNQAKCINQPLTPSVDEKSRVLDVLENEQIRNNPYIEDNMDILLGGTATSDTEICRVRKQGLQSRSTPKANPRILRIQADLNSPSASLRVRAHAAIRSPTQNDYAVFDVSHNEQSIITAEDRNPPAPVSIQDVMSNVIVYVEVRSGEDNRSEGVKAVIGALGARVNNRLLRNTTHVIFKDGLLSTYKKARAWNIPVVSILWIEACKNKRILCDPEKFPITNLDKYENPELYPKMMRQRNMQPDSEVNKRIRKPATPTTKDVTTPKAAGADITPTSSQAKKTDISQFFKVISKKDCDKAKILSTIDQVESPATKYLNRITSGALTPLNQKIDSEAKPVNTSDAKLIGDVANDDNNTPLHAASAKKSLMFAASGESKKSVKSVSSMQQVQRHRSMDAISIPASTPSSHSTPGRMTRRRSSLLNNSSVNINPISMSISQSNFQSIIEEENSELQNVKNSTNYEQMPLEITEVVKYTEAGHTLCKEKSMDISTESKLPNSVLSSSVGTGPFTPTQGKLCALLEEDAKLTSTFNSTRIPTNQNRRRSFFDISMEIINQRILTINETSKRKSLAMNQLRTESPVRRSLSEFQTPTLSLTNNDISLNENGSAEEKPDETKSAAVTTTESGVELTDGPIRKRKLFDPVNDLIMTPKNESVTKGTPCKSTSVTKRRRSLMPGGESAKSNLTAKPRATRRSTLDFEQIKSLSKNNEELIAKTDKKTQETVEKPPNEGQTKQLNELTKAKPEIGAPLQLPTKKRRLSNLVYTNMRQEQITVIRQAIKKLGCFRIQSAVNKATSHVVSLEPRRTLNLMRGLMRGTWILQYRWVLDSLRAGAWLNEEHYEMKIFSRAVEICRAERQAFGRNYHCELFRHMELFYVSARSKNISCEQLTELLALGNANLTDHRYKAKYIIGDKRRELDDKIYLSPQWVLDSIAAMQIQKFSKYLMPSAIIPLPKSMLPDSPTPPLRIFPPTPYV